MNGSAKVLLFPLIRHSLGNASSVLARLPVTANQITVASLVSGFKNHRIG